MVPSLSDCVRPEGSGDAGDALQVSEGRSWAEPGVLQRELGCERGPRTAAASLCGPAELKRGKLSALPSLALCAPVRLLAILQPLRTGEGA